MKGFKKDGKFRPTGNRNKSSLKKEDIVHQHSEDRIGRTLPLTRKKVGSCKTCGMKFTAKDYKNASEGKESLVGDWDDQCYPCQFKERDKKSVDALGTPNDEVDHEELFNESDHDFVDYMSEGQIEDIANDYLYSLSKDMTQHDKLKALQGYLNGEFGSNPADEDNLNSLASHLVFEEEQGQFEKEEHARYLEEERFYKENNTSEEEEREKYFKEHPDEARSKETIDEVSEINIKNYEKKSKLITDAERRTLEQRGSDEWREDHETGNYPDDGMTTRSNQDSNQNFTIQTRAVARKELDERSKKTRRDNPQTPLIEEVPFGKDSRPKHDKISGSLLEQDTRDSHLALDYTDELNPISRAGYRSTGFGSGVTEKPRRQDWTRIIAKKKTIEVNQTEGQKNRADKAVREGTHKHVGFTNLVKDIKKNNKSLSDDSANKIAGYIQAKSKKKFGSKTVSKGGRKHVEPAI